MRGKKDTQQNFMADKKAVSTMRRLALRMEHDVETFRQGDVLLVRIDESEAKCLIADVAPVARENGRVVLAHGEVTGHSHALVQSAVKLYEVEKTVRMTILIVPTTARVYHEEHSAITLRPGAYEVIRQVEYTPNEIRTVAD